MNVDALISLVVGLISGLAGAMMGVKIAVARLEAQMADARTEIKMLRDRAHECTRDLLRLDARIHALEEHEEESR